MSLFIREPESLEGYTPPKTKQETLLGYETESVKIGGGLGDLDYDFNNPRYETQHSIEILGKRFYGRKSSYFGLDEFDIVADIANEVLGDKSHSAIPEAQEWLQIHAKDLNNSKRYWKAWTRVQLIEAEKEKLREMQAQIAKGLILASVDAVEVKAERSFSESERRLLIAEFSGGESWERS